MPLPTNHAPNQIITSADVNDLAALVNSQSENTTYFHGVGDGFTDDTTALQAFLNTLKTTGGLGVLPAYSTIKITSALALSSGTKPFHILGNNATIKRGADFGSVWQITSTDNWSMSDLIIDGGVNLFPTNASHGLILLDCSKVWLRNIKVNNYRNTGIMVYVTTPGSDADVWIDRCEVIGNGVDTNNGMLLANMQRSTIINSVARNILGNPGIGMQLKNSCVNSRIINGFSENCDDGFSFGSDTVGQGPRRSQMENLQAINCNLSYAIGESYNNNYNNLFSDSQSKATSRGAIYIESDAKDQTIDGLYIVNSLAGQNPIRVDGIGCVVEASYVENEGTAATVAFLANSNHNYVSLKRAVVNNVPIASNPASLFTNAGTNNVFNFRGSNV